MGAAKGTNDWSNGMSELDFSYAEALLQHKEGEFEFVGDVKVRDSLFQDLLSTFSGPIKVFQVGAIESLDGRFRVGSGWSDTFFGDYILKNGGSLTIADINLDHLAHSFLVARSRGYDLQLKLGDAINHIKSGYDIYYLDGADEPLGHQQTLEQFQRIETTKSLVIVDDVETKARLLQQYLKANEINFTFHDIGNGGMITVDMREH
tara:strand:- start:150 stop:767 length:618 start_codon:yes stop_codon:yes gene_type:complete